MKRNKPISETELLDVASDILLQSLPEGWRVNLVKGRRAAHRILRIKPPGRKPVDIQILIRPGFQPRDIPALSKEPAPSGALARVLIAPFLSPTTRSRLGDCGLGYVDTTGAVQVTVDAPDVAIHLRAEGSGRNPFPDDRPLRSLKGPSAARVIRALCDFTPPFGIRELAERCRASPAVASRVVGLLESEGLVEREPRNPVVRVNWPGVLRRWTQDYGFSNSHIVRANIEPRGHEALLKKLTGSRLNYALTAELAVSHLVQEAPPRSVALFVEDMPEARKLLKLTETDAGANVMLAEPFDDVVFARSRTRGGLRLVAPSQAAADLLTGPGRSPSVGEVLIAWMQEHENEWRD